MVSRYFSRRLKVLVATTLCAAAQIAGPAPTQGQTISPAGAEALIRLGDLYAQGDGIQRNVARAIEFYQKAADLGSATAKLSLGEILVQTGKSDEERKRGLELVKAVADEGSRTALVSLGDLYSRGEGIAMDPELARQNYETAAKSGNAVAMLRLGDLYRSGRFEPPRPKMALPLYKQAAAAGNSYAMASLGRMLIESKGKRGVLAEGEALLKQAAKAGLEDADVALATRYFYGSGVAQNPNQAIKLLQAASARGNTAAMEELIAAYRTGKRDGRSTLVRRDDKQARSLLQKFAVQLPPGHESQNKMMLDCRTASPKKRDGLYGQLLSMPLRDKRSLMRDLQDECPGFYAFIVQKQLQAIGFLKAGSSKVASAAAKYCRRTGTAYFCSQGLYGPHMAEMIGYSFE